MKYNSKKVLKKTSLDNIKMGHPTNHLLFSCLDEANEKVRNFNENLNFPISHDICHFFMIP